MPGSQGERELTVGIDSISLIAYEVKEIQNIIISYY
jgi:hypothetical protein